jgi:hypothetical protein
MKQIYIGIFKIEISESQKALFLNNVMFKNKAVEFINYTDLSFMLDDLRKGKISYFICLLESFQQMKYLMRVWNWFCA